MRIQVDTELGRVLVERAREMVDAIASENDLLTRAMEVLDKLERPIFEGAMQMALDQTNDVQEVLASCPQDVSREAAKWPTYASGLMGNAMAMIGVAINSLKQELPPDKTFDVRSIANFIEYTGLTVLGTQVWAAAVYDFYGKVDREIGIGNLERLGSIIEALKNIAPPAEFPKARVVKKKRAPKVSFPSKLDV